MFTVEYLSRFSKKDRLTPVVTLVIYFNSDRWDGPMSIHDMIDTKEPGLMKYVQDYRINLISPADITSEELNSFSTSLGKVLGYIKYSKDKDKLLSYVTGNPDIKIDADAARVISEVTKTNIEIQNSEEEIDMCKAIDDLIKDSKAEGESIGLSKGRAEGIVAGRADLVNSLLRKYLSLIHI